MRGEINHLDNDTLFLDQIDEAILLSKTGRTVAFPFASKSFISKALYESQAPRPGNYNDIFPLLVSLQNLCRNFGKSPYDAPMLKYLPHTKYSIYTIFSMSSSQSCVLAAKHLNHAADTGTSGIKPESNRYHDYR
jgi:hypothetical protein